MILLADARPLLDRSSGGVRRVTAGLVNALSETAGTHELILASTGLEVPTPGHRHRRFPNKFINACSLAGIPYDAWFNTKADAIFFPNLAWTGTPRRPYSVVVHDLSFLIEPRWFNVKSRLWHKLARPITFLKKANLLFAVSEQTKKDLINVVGVNPDRITVIPLGIEPLPNLTLADASDASASADASPYLLALGLGNPRKNADGVIQAWRIARKTFPELKLILIGPGQHTPETGIEIHPSPTDSELSNLMQHASAFLYPSWYEGFGLPLHEAAFFGTPCIASTAGSLPETPPTGTLFAPPHKPHLWAAAIQTILKNPTGYKTQTQTRTWDEAAKMIWKKLSV